MSMRQRVKEAMDFIREQTKDLSEECYEEFLEQLKFELEAKSELCCWGRPGRRISVEPFK